MRAPPQQSPRAALTLPLLRRFSWEIWLVVLSALVFGGIAMYFFEGEDSNEDYGPKELNFVLRISRGCYKGFRK